MIRAFTEVVVRPLNAPASTTTKVVTPTPMFAGGSMVTAPPEIVTDEDETPIVENAVPDALFSLNVILPVPVATPTLKVMMILEFKETPVAPIAGLKVMGTGGTFIEVAVRTPTVIVSLTIFAVFAIPVRFAPEPTNEVAVITPVALRPEELNVSPVPTLIVFVLPFNVILEDPTVRIPVTRAFPSTNNAVVPIPIVTVPDALVIVVIPVTLIPLAFTFRTDAPEETTVNCPVPGEKNPVCWSPTKNIDGDAADPGEKDTFVKEVIIPTLKGAASTQYASVPYPTTFSS